MRTASGQKNSPVSGFTLVELLVVITIIGILMGLLIPAVQAAREAARKTQCSTQINNLAKAATIYEMNKKEYPGWIRSYGSFVSGPDPSDPTGATAPDDTQKLGGWVVALMPYLDAQPTYEIWTQDKYPVIGADLTHTTRAAPNLAIMQCPSSTTVTGLKGRNSYVSNNGMNHTDVPTGVTSLMTMSRSNGVFNAKSGGVIGPAVRSDDLKDGLSTTVLFSENLQARPWHQLFPPGLASPATIDSRFAQGIVWHYRDLAGLGTPAAELPDPVHLINGAGMTGVPGNDDLFGLEMDSTNYMHVARPSSGHVGGVNMGFADGASRFVQQGIDYRVYQALMTPRGKSSNVPFSEYVLEGEAL